MTLVLRARWLVAACGRLTCAATCLQGGGSSGLAEPRPQVELLSQLPAHMAQGSRATSVRGQVQVLDLAAGSDPAQLQQVLGAWLQQPAFAWAVVAGPRRLQSAGDAMPAMPGSAGSTSAAEQQAAAQAGSTPLAGLAVCYSTRQVLYLDLSTGGGPQQAENVTLAAMHAAVVQAFSNPQVTAATYGLQAALASLLQAGLEPRCRLQDAQVAYQHWCPQQVSRGCS